MKQPSQYDLDSSEQRILNNFFTRGRLKIIPSKQKKRDIVLRYLAGKFESGRMYPEREVNDILLSYHEDCASLRRWLVDTGLLHRQIVRIVEVKARLEGKPEVDYEISYWRL